MTQQSRTAAEAVQKQHATILEAIAIMQAALDTMTGTIDPETTSWRDVSEFARIAGAARAIIEQHEECQPRA